MSQPGQKPAASPRPRRAAAARHTQEHVSEKTSGSPSKSGEKKGSDEKKATSLESSQPSRTHAGGTAPATKASAASPSTSKSSSMNPTETKPAKTEPEKKSQSTKPSAVHEKKTQEVKPKEHKEPKSLPKHASDAESKHVHKEKKVSRSSEQPTSEKSSKPKTKSQDAVSAGGEGVVAGVAAAPATPAKQKKEKKSLTSAVPVESKPGKPSGKSDMDAALDDLVDTLGGPEETEDDNTVYTGPEVSDPMTSTYIEELGKREVTLPPKYRELLAKKEGIPEPPPDSSKPMGPNDAIDALSSDFTCSSPTPGGKETKEEKATEEVLKAQPATVVKSAASPQEKKRKVEEDAMSDQALEALSESLGSRKPEPELDLSSITEVDEAKAKEEKLKKCGEDEETVPSEYRLKPATDKDGKPLLPEHEEKSKPLSESELIDELSEDFNQPKSKGKQTKPSEKTEESQAAALTPVSEAVPRTSMCSIQSAPPKPPTLKGMGPDDAVEALAGSLGKKEPDPEDGKPVADKVKEKAEEEDREKLGEKEETIPPDYRLEEVKDKDGKPLLPEHEEKSKLPPLSESELIDELSEDFNQPKSNSSSEFEDAKLSAVISEVVSQTPAPATHSAGPPPGSQSDDKELDDALDQLSDSLGQRQPDPDDNKPIEDKVKERAKAEHRDKLGERDDTIPPEYRHLLDDDEGKPAKPPAKKPKDSKKPEDEKDPIDALSGDLDSCPAPTEDKVKRTAPSSKVPKNGGKAKDSAKAKEETSKLKADETNTS
ncbi:calpastatin isoform X10 [Ailuropoda melanoleuca]|uniref:calpastatin isoform X10 n=1 Tax=Ailuropoda melanoleuca TaxID=9646 RepID=UPI001494DE59|nr:calpastatin isoform X10 [Ailuropoda melanoleuca]